MKIQSSVSKHLHVDDILEFRWIYWCQSCFLTVNWLDHGRTLREQGVEESEMLLLRRKFFYSDQNVDSRDPVQLNLLYVQVNTNENHLYIIIMS